MSFRGAFNEWLSIIIKVGAIGAVVLVVVWLSISGVANFLETPYGMPDYPDVNKAQYQVLLKTTGMVYLTNEYDIIADGVYTLYGYYELDKGKWRWRDVEVTISEDYFGDIDIVRRQQP